MAAKIYTPEMGDTVVKALVHLQPGYSNLVAHVNAEDMEEVKKLLKDAKIRLTWKADVATRLDGTQYNRFIAQVTDVRKGQALLKHDWASMETILY